MTKAKIWHEVIAFPGDDTCELLWCYDVPVDGQFVISGTQHTWAEALARVRHYQRYGITPPCSRATP